MRIPLVLLIADAGRGPHDLMYPQMTQEQWRRDESRVEAEDGVLLPGLQMVSFRVCRWRKRGTRGRLHGSKSSGINSRSSPPSRPSCWVARDDSIA
jgi:hypothetical protein